MGSVSVLFQGSFYASEKFVEGVSFSKPVFLWNHAMYNPKDIHLYQLSVC